MRLGGTFFSGSSERGVKRQSTRQQGADGVFPNEFLHGILFSDQVPISITKERYIVFCTKRYNLLWSGEERVRKMLLYLKSTMFPAGKISLVIQSMHIDHEQLIEKIERNVE